MAERAVVYYSHEALLSISGLGGCVYARGGQEQYVVYIESNRA